MAEGAVRRPDDFQDLIEQLKTSCDKSYESAPFENYAQIMAFAAVVGAKLRPHEFHDNYKSYGDPIKLKVFENDGLDGIIHILAVQKEKNLNILTDEENGKRKISIFEGYAYAGFKELKSVINHPGINLDNLIDFVERNIKRNDTENEIDLKELILD